MKKRFMQFVSFLLIFSLCILPGAQAVSPPGLGADQIVRIGLYFDITAVASVILTNQEGFSFGFYDDSAAYTSVAGTSETSIAVLKTKMMYFSNGSYSDTVPDGSYSAIGVYHLQLPGSYDSFDSAAQAAAEIGGFPAWINGSYYVRLGAYSSVTEASGAQAAWPDSTVVWTTAYSYNVLAAGTDRILFQFDGGSAYAMAAVPGSGGWDGAATELLSGSSKCSYYGAFVFSRPDGGNMTVANYLPIETYVEGVIPYEMSASWPLEALKAQAVCARTYAAVCYNNHKGSGFDLCATDHCQVYKGLGNSTSYPTANSNQAVEETAGQYAMYNGSYAETLYHSSDGGATEDVSNVWSGSKQANYPYLVGIVDPYEATVSAGISNYNWTLTYTGDQLAELLRPLGYNCSTITDVSAKYTANGNVYAITFTDSNGKSYTRNSGSAVRSLLSSRSIRFTVSKGGSAGSSYYINSASGQVSGLSGLYTIDGTGSTANISPDGLYVITSSGTSTLSASGTQNNQFTFTGTGWGHSIGMSQWGAYAMAKAGYTYTDILTFYYTGISIQSIN